MRNLLTLVLLAGLAVAGSIWSSGLMVSLSLENSALDGSGNGNNGTWVGTTAYADGSFGRAADLDGASYISATKLSLAVWTVHLRVKYIGSTGAEHTFFGSFDGTHRIGVTGTVGVSLDVMTSNSYYERFNIAGWSDGNWHSITYTWNGTAIVFIYDGIARTANSTGNPTNVSIEALYIGARLMPTPDKYAKVLVDELQVWNRALTQQEIQRVMMGLTP